MQSNDIILTFIKDLRSIAHLWDVRCVDYKNHSKKVMRFSCEKYETTATDFDKTSRTSKVSYRESIKNSSVQEEWVCCFVTTERVQRMSQHRRWRSKWRVSRAKIFYLLGIFGKFKKQSFPVSCLQVPGANVPFYGSSTSNVFGGECAFLALAFLRRKLCK
jgi:hypothetical protein